MCVKCAFWNDTSYISRKIRKDHIARKVQFRTKTYLVIKLAFAKPACFLAPHKEKFASFSATRLSRLVPGPRSIPYGITHTVALNDPMDQKGPNPGPGFSGLFSESLDPSQFNY